MLASFPILAQATALAPESPPVSMPFLHAALLTILWIFVAAILIGPLIKWRFGDLWQQDPQPFTDDTSHH